MLNNPQNMNNEDPLSNCSWQNDNSAPYYHNTNEKSDIFHFLCM